MPANKLFFLLFFLLLGGWTNAQLIIKNDMSKEDLVAKILLRDSSGVAINQVKYTGSEKAIGVFYTSTESFLMKKGIVISTGLAKNADGPNESDRASSVQFTPGDRDLDIVAGSNTADAAILEFVFYPNTDEISFEYFFASEEYPEFVNHGVNDVFVFFISGPGYDKPTNIATLPTTGEPITVDHVNQIKNSEFFIPNRLWGDDLSTYTIDQAELSYAFEYDGLTRLLEAKAHVIPYKPYKLKIAIADVGDNIYDSGVFLRAKSFKSTGVTIPFTKLIEDDLNQINLKERAISYKILDQMVILQSNIQFDFNSFDLGNEYFDALDSFSEILIQYFDINLTLVGHTDDVGTDAYNMELSEARAQSICNYLVSKGIKDTRIKVDGK
jgi:hypothetical protein